MYVSYYLIEMMVNAHTLLFNSPFNSTSPRWKVWLKIKYEDATNISVQGNYLYYNIPNNQQAPSIRPSWNGEGQTDSS